MKADINHLHEILSDLVEQLKQLGAKKIILFGSLSRGQVRIGSDIDLLVFFDDQDHFKTRMRRLYSVLESDADFDLLAYNREEFERIKHRSLFRHILKEGKVLYEA